MVVLDVDFIPVRVFQTQGRGLLLSGGFAIASTPGYSYRSPRLASRPFGRHPAEKTLSGEVRKSLAGARFPSFRTPSGRKEAVRGSQKVARRGSLPVLSDAVRSKRRCPRKSESRLPGLASRTFGRRPVEKRLSEEVRESLAGARFPSFRTPSGRKEAVRGSQKVARRDSLPVLSDAVRSKRRCPGKSESRSPRIALWTLSEVGRLSSNDLCPLSFSDDIISTIFDDIISTRGYNGNCRGVAISIFWSLG